MCQAAVFSMAFLSCFIFSVSQADTCKATIKDRPRVEWVGFKFTEKKAVRGEIKDAEFSSSGTESIDDVIAKTTFTINPMKVSSGDEARDTNLRNFFFKLMKNNASIRGRVVSFDKSNNEHPIQVELIINGVTKTVPFSLTKQELSSVTKTSKGSGKKSEITKQKSHSYIAEGDIDILDFQMKKSLGALSKACHEVHKGQDGVSKTWSQVHLIVSGEISESCGFSGN